MMTQGGWKAVTKVLHAAGIVVASGLGCVSTQAQEYPSRPIHIISATAPGGGGDTLVRYFARKLEPLAKQPVVVENKVGAGGLIGVRAAIAAKPDGYTLLIHASSSIIGNAYVVRDSGYDPARDLTPISPIARAVFVLLVGPKSPVKSVADLTALLKEKKGAGTYASPNNATAVSTELYMQAAGVNAVRVNYKAVTTAILDVAAGEVDFAFADLSLAVSQAKAGRVRLLAVSSRQRAAVDPSIPTMIEAGFPGFEYSVFFGAWAPAKTPEPVIDKLVGWFQQVLATDETKGALVNLGFEALSGSSNLLAQMVHDDAQRWSELTKSGRIKQQ